VNRSRGGGSAIAPPATAGRIFAWRTVGMAGLWVVLTGADPKTPWLAALIVLGAAWASVRLFPAPFGIRAGGAALFTLFFLHHSLRGGIDVALRAIRSPPAVEPGLIDFPLRLPPGTARTFFITGLGLLPGTLSRALSGDVVRVHVLDRRVDIAPQLRRMEAHVAAAFGLELPFTED
jgi:multicomponent Na+:H+ antiporter subunit E